MKSKNEGAVENEKMGKQREFSDTGNRNRKINAITLIILTLIEALIIFAMVVQVFTDASYGMMGIVPTAIMVVSSILNWILYKKNKSSTKLRYVMMAGYLIGWAYLMITGKNAWVITYIYPILIATILYYDKKFEKFTYMSAFIITIARAIMWGINGTLTESPETFVSIVMSVVVFIIIHITAKTAIRFDYDAIWTVKEEETVIKDMMDKVLSISANARQQIESTDELMGNLSKSSEVVYNSIQEISVSTQVTAESVQEQTIMTSQIRDDIGETAENAKIMVDVANASEKMVEESMEVMSNMRASAQQISETNSSVAESMKRLQEKAKEVQHITEVIFSISSQTNLLALNASIESARAGEAGRGFAVVAEQIRELSELTRKSTEQISGIITELNVDAQNATGVVQSSIDAMNIQNEMIEQASDGFSVIQNNVEILTQRVQDIYSKIENLVKSNNTIIENISQLSAVSEEVSASAQEVEERSQHNQIEAQQAKELLNEVRGIVDELAAYQKI